MDMCYQSCITDILFMKSDFKTQKRNETNKNIKN